jgi:hypothetical protein
MRTPAARATPQTTSMFLCVASAAAFGHPLPAVQPQPPATVQPQLPPWHRQPGPHLQGDLGQSPPHLHPPPPAHPHEPSLHKHPGPQLQAIARPVRQARRASPWALPGAPWQERWQRTKDGNPEASMHRRIDSYPVHTKDNREYLSASGALSNAHPSPTCTCTWSPAPGLGVSTDRRTELLLPPAPAARAPSACPLMKRRLKRGPRGPAGQRASGGSTGLCPRTALRPLKKGWWSSSGHDIMS